MFVSFLQLIVWRNRNSCEVWGGEEPPVSALLYFGFSCVLCHVGPTNPWIWTFKKSSFFITEETIVDITVYCSPEARFLVFLKSVFPCLFNRRTLAPENDPLCPHSMLKLLSWAVLSGVLWLLGNGWRNNWNSGSRMLKALSYKCSWWALSVQLMLRDQQCDFHSMWDVGRGDGTALYAPVSRSFYIRELKRQQPPRRQQLHVLNNEKE